MNHPTEAALTAFTEYLERYLRRRDLPRTLAMLSKDFSVIGTGIDEWAPERPEAEALYVREMAQAPGSMQHSVASLSAQFLGPEAILVLARLTLETVVGAMPWAVPLRISAVMVREEGAWHLAHKHVSIPSSEQGEGEGVPLAMLEARNRELERLVTVRTAELEARARDLEVALARIRTLKGLVPICAWCKQVRDDEGYWHDVADYVAARTEADFTHGMCPTCARQFVPRHDA